MSTIIWKRFCLIIIKVNSNDLTYVIIPVGAVSVASGNGTSMSEIDRHPKQTHENFQRHPVITDYNAIVVYSDSLRQTRAREVKNRASTLFVEKESS